MRKTVLEFRSVSTNLPAAQNINDVSFFVFEGEFVSLVGTDCSGKASILKLLNGECACSRGKMLLSGREYAPHGIGDAHRRGVYCISQISNLLNDQSLAENYFINVGHIPLFSRVHDRLYEQETASLLAEFGIDIDPAVKVGNYSENMNCILEMLKYTRLGAKLIVLSNVMKSGTPAEYELFLRIAGKLTARGISILLLTNQSGDYLRHTNRLMVLSHTGRLAGTLYPEDFSIERLESYLTNSISNVVTRIHPGSPGREVLRVDGERAGVQAAFSLHEGEVIGLLGENERDLLSFLRAKFAAHEGGLWIDGKRRHICSETDIDRLGIGFIPDDPRRIYYPDLSIEDNAIMPFLRLASGRCGIIRSGSEKALRQDVRTWMQRLKEEFDYNATDASIYAVLIRFLMYPYRIVVMSNPSRINDSRKIKMLLWLVGTLIRRGTAFIIISGNEEELRAMCSRVFKLS